MSELSGRNIHACWTFRENRTNHCSLKAEKVIQKDDRGSFDYRSDGNALCVKWNDNRAVTVASNYTKLRGT